MSQRRLLRIAKLLPRLKIAVSLLILGLSVYFARVPILQSAAYYLVDSQAPVPADLILVLGGDSIGVRASRGCQLLQQNFSSRLWLSGGQDFFGIHESDAARDFVLALGCPADQVTALKFPVDSTRDEAKYIGRAMREQGLRSCLLVTSNFHTRRTARIFRALNPDLSFTPVAAFNQDFLPEEWWRHRHSRRTFLTEWTKTVAYWAGL